MTLKQTLQITTMMSSPTVVCLLFKRSDDFVTQNASSYLSMAQIRNSGNACDI